MLGTIFLTLDEAKDYKSIEVELHGGAHVHWTETYTVSTGQSTTTYTVPYDAKETYVEQTNVVWNSEESPSGTIGPGTYSYRFEFSLPQDALPSFKGKLYGKIEYIVRGRIRTGHLLQRDPRTEVPIQVNVIRDVNLPEFATSAHQSTQKQVGCCCFASSLEHSVDVTRTGFSIGSNVPMTVNVVNGSSRRIKMRASIKKIVVFYAGGHVRQERSKLAFVLSDDIAPHSQHSWSMGNLVVPTTEPSFEGSAIIKMQYVVKVTALIPWAKNSSVSIPITIGTVPLSGSVIQETEFT